MQSNVLSWMEPRGIAVVALGAAMSWLPPSVAAASIAEAAAEARPPSEAQAPEQELRHAAASRLDASLKAKLEAMSDEAVGALLQAPEEAKLTAEEQAIRGALGKEMFERRLSYRTGDIQIGDGLATLRLGEDFRYLNDADAQKLLVEGWGNPPGMETLGMIVPTNVSPLDETRGWAVVVSYTEDGHVEDDDAKDIDYDELLEEMKEDTQASNEQRIEQGYGALELVGWAAPPRYDATTHRLYWAKELAFAGAPEHTVNYAIRVLGRKGVLELNAVAGMSQLASVQTEMERVLPRAEFGDGSRYADFNPGVDKVAAYGIGGLIAGKVLAKAGLFALLLKLLIAGKKLVVLGIVGIGALIMRALRGRQSAGQ